MSQHYVYLVQWQHTLPKTAFLWKCQIKTQPLVGAQGSRLIVERKSADKRNKNWAQENLRLRVSL